MAKVKGSCLCGDVTYESTAEPQMTAVCHCTHCQKTSGSAFSVNLAVPADSFKMSGSPSRYEDKGTSGMPVFRTFCGKCGSAIVSEVVAFPGLMFVKAGTLDDTSWVKPGLEIWTDSAQSWVTMCPNTDKFKANPG